MKYGAYLEEQMLPEWKESYMSYKQLKKILKALGAQHLTRGPAEWNMGVSLTTHSATNVTIPWNKRSDKFLNNRLYYLHQAAAMPPVLMPDAVWPE